MPEEIFIPATTLTEFLVNAENAEVMIKENTGVRHVLSKVVRKRRRQSTPADEIDEIKEKKFIDEVERAEKRAKREDKDWRP
jgi:hypothetical protein